MSSEEKEIAALSYEQAIAELDGLIGKLEGGEVPLADAIAAYERGAKLAQHCAELLDRTEAQVTQLVVSGSGKVEEKGLEVSGADTGTELPRAKKASAADTLFGTPTARAARSDEPPIDPDDIPF